MQMGTAGICRKVSKGREGAAGQIDQPRAARRGRRALP